MTTEEESPAICAICGRPIAPGRGRYPRIHPSRVRVETMQTR